MLLNIEIKERKILWVSSKNQNVWGGDVIGYRNINTNKILSKSQYDEMIEREVFEKWNSMNIEEMMNYKDFDEFRKSILDDPDLDYDPLIEEILSSYIDEEDLTMYEPYVEMHWLEILSLEHNTSIYEIAKKGNISKSTLYNIISKKIQLNNISAVTLNSILKGLEISISEFIYKYDNRFLKINLK